MLVWGLFFLFVDAGCFGCRGGKHFWTDVGDVEALGRVGVALAIFREDT
jgi:hypothetical protein